MKLSTKEFDAMQMGWRKWYIEKIELKTFEKFGLDLRNADVLEVGCGNGYAASLLTERGVNSYTGLDIMPEQLAIARNRKLPKASFMLGSADDLSLFRTGASTRSWTSASSTMWRAGDAFLTRAAGC